MQAIDYILSNIDMKFYYLQQQLSILISLKLSSINFTTFTILLMAGIITSLNPCLLPILPLSVSYLYSNINDIKLLNKLMFLIGIISSLIGMIFMTSLLSQQYYNLINTIPIFSSIFIIFIGLNLLKIINVYHFFIDFNNLNFFFRVPLFRNYLIGLVLGFSSMPCSMPIVLSILVWLLSAKYWFLGCLYLFIYCLGYTLPLIILISWVLNNNQISSIISSWNYIIPFSGSCILGLGIFSFLEKIFI